MLFIFSFAKKMTENVVQQLAVIEIAAEEILTDKQQVKMAYTCVYTCSCFDVDNCSGQKEK